MTQDGRRRAQDFEFEFGLNAEVLWSPDLTRFAVTGSEGGAVGQYRTAVVTIKGDGLAWTDLTPMIERAFGHPVKCFDPEVPNVGAVVWLSTGQLVVAAEIMSHSNCDSFGTFAAYTVDVITGHVGRRYDQLDAKRRWRSALGIELLDAPDECIRTPRACWVAANHRGGH